MPSSLFGPPNLQMINLLRSSKNPNALMQTLAQQNPAMRNVMSLVNKHNGDAKAAFYALAKEKGVNPDEVISYLNNLK